MTLQIHLQNPSEWMSKSYPAHWVHGLQQLSSKMRYVQVTCKQGVGMYILFLQINPDYFAHCHRDALPSCSD